MNLKKYQLNLFSQLIIWIIISAFLVYYIPVAFNRLLILLLFIPIWRSRNDYFWFAFLIIILDYPGGLFSGGGINDPYRLPVYNLAPGVSFAFSEIYVVVLLLKAILKKRWREYRLFPYRKQFSSLAIYLIVLIFVSLALGASFTSMRNIYRILIALSIYYSALNIFKRENDVINFFKIMFPFAFVALLLQMYGLLYHQQLVALFKPGITAVQGAYREGQIMRPIEMNVVLLICFFGSLLYMNCRNRPFIKLYLIVVMMASYTSILLAATRTWFLAFSFMAVLFLFVNFKRVARSTVTFAAGLGVFVLILSFFPVIRNQVEQSWTRLKTVEELVDSEITETSMRNRTTVRGPRVMEGFSQSSILFGAGFSDLYYEYSDGHVGFHNILLNSGIVGMIVLFSFALTLFFKPFQVAHRVQPRSDLKSILINLPLMVPAVLLINTGTQFWGYDLGGTRVMMLAFYISISSVYIRAHKQPSVLYSIKEPH